MMKLFDAYCLVLLCSLLGGSAFAQCEEDDGNDCGGTEEEIEEVLVIGEGEDESWDDDDWDV